jgi:MFS family permease
VTHRLADAGAAFASNARNRSLRLAQLAFAAVWASEWGFLVGLSVVAFRAGGPPAVAIVAAARTAPAAVVAPFATALADRVPRDRVLIWACGVRAAAAGVAAALTASAPGAVYALAVLATAAFTIVRPAHSALLPALCRTPQELASASVVRGLMDACGTLAGPALAAVLLAVSGPDAVFAAVAAASAGSAWAIARIGYEPAVRAAVGRPRLLREAAEGFAAVVRHGDVAVIFGMALTQIFTRGALTVLVVVLALDLLGGREADVGLLTSAIGAGAVVGSLATGLLAGGRDLARWDGVGSALWGLALVVIAAFPRPAVAVAALAVVGVGNALVDVGLFTLPVRIVPETLLGRVFGVFESLGALAVAAGALAASLAVHALGGRGAMVAIGLISPLTVAASWLRLRRIDHRMVARDAEIAILRSAGLLRMLPLPAIEELAIRSRAAVVADGHRVFAEGDLGDSFYVVAEGGGEVRRDGRLVRTLHPGDGFGEIALLRGCRRTATVVARGRLALRVVESDAFVSALTGHRPSAGAAQEHISGLLEGDARAAAAEP